MPKILRAKLPPALMAHLVLRLKQRDIPYEDVVLFSAWVDTEPEVPFGPWFKRFPKLVVCGEGELVKHC